MTYEEFVAKGTEYYMKMVTLIATKHTYRMQFTDEEKQINGYIMEFQEETKINELRNKFQKCWEIEE
tara:strand:- start:436 stop:636 length:201 start_codon:yes stop_codon:yes gene_type:complete